MNKTNTPHFKLVPTFCTDSSSFIPVKLCSVHNSLFILFTSQNSHLFQFSSKNPFFFWLISVSWTHFGCHRATWPNPTRSFKISSSPSNSVPAKATQQNPILIFLLKNYFSVIENPIIIQLYVLCIIIRGKEWRRGNTQPSCTGAEDLPLRNIGCCY